MEYVPVTEADCVEAMAQLIQHEPIFHRSEFGTSRSALEAMTADDFWEIGASGRRYSRQFVLDAVEKRLQQPVHEHWETTDFQCQRVAENVYLLSYTLRQDARVTRRSTIWKKTDGDWQIVFHQGTIVESSSDRKI